MTSWFNLEPILEPCSIFNEIYGQSSILVGKTHTFSAVNHHHWQNLGKISRFFHGVSKCLTRNWRWNPKILPNSTFVLSIVEDMVLFFFSFFSPPVASRGIPWHPVAAMADPVVRNVGQGEERHGIVQGHQQLVAPSLVHKATWTSTEYS